MTFGHSFRDIAAVSASAGGTAGVFYDYQEVDPNIDFLTVGYAYSDGTELADEVTGCRAAATQEIMNNFPSWMLMRQKHDSVGQDLVNSWGCHLEFARTRYIGLRKDQFLITADQYNETRYAVSDLSFNEVRVYEVDFRNMLYNSSFGMVAPARYQRPEGWTTQRNSIEAVSFNKTDSLWGNHSVELDGSYSHAELKQSRDVTLSSGKLNLSIYAKTVGADSSLSTVERYTADTAGIVLVLRYADGTVSSYGVGFPKNTEDKWVRASFSTDVVKELTSFEVFIVNRTDQKFRIDLPQLEQNSRATAWSYSRQDVHKYSSSLIRNVGGVQVLMRTESGNEVNKVEVFPLDSEEEFVDNRVPTRIERFSPGKNALQTVNKTWGRQVNYFKENMPTKWDIADGKLRESYTLAPDKFGDHLPAELYLDQEGTRHIDKTAINDEITTAKAATIYDGWVYLVVEEVYGGITRQVLKFMKTDKVNYEDDFLQSWGDIEVPLDLGVSFGDQGLAEEVDRIGICKNIADTIFIDTTLDRRFYFKLKYDYFFADFTTRKIFCRENYTALNGFLQVI